MSRTWKAKKTEIQYWFAFRNMKLFLLFKYHTEIEIDSPLGVNVRDPKERKWKKLELSFVANGWKRRREKMQENAEFASLGNSFSKPIPKRVQLGCPGAVDQKGVR